jgi:AMMECR1 domain-containing protein
MKKITASLLFIIFLPVLNTGQNNALSDWKKFSGTKNSIKLINYLRNNAFNYLNKTATAKNSLSDITSPPFYGKLGLFITIIKGEKVRGCYGSFSHRSDSIENVLNEYLLGALKSDPRYKPIEPDDLDSAEIILTVTDQPVPVYDLDSTDLKKMGVVISLDSGEKSVFVPAEIKTSSYIKKEFRGREYQAEVFNSVTIRIPR